MRRFLYYGFVLGLLGLMTLPSAYAWRNGNGLFGRFFNRGNDNGNVSFRGRVRFRGNENWNNNREQAFQSPFPEDNGGPAVYLDQRDQSGPNLRNPNGCTTCGQFPQAYAQAQVYEAPAWYPSVEQPIYYPEERNWRAYAWRNRDAAGLEAREAMWLRGRDDRNWRAYALAGRDDSRLGAYLALGQDEREAARAAWWANRDDPNLAAWALVDRGRDFGRRGSPCDNFGLPIPDPRGRLDELDARLLALEARRGLGADLDARLLALERDRLEMENGMVAILRDRSGRELRRTRFGTRCPLCLTLEGELVR